jgi:thiol-disulfide isomerase/thioredoxin
MFLLGKGIPDHITNLPQTVLDTPFGRVLAPQVNQMVERKRKTGLVGLAPGATSSEAHKPHLHHTGPSLVKHATTNLELQRILDEAKDSCAVVFFTSESCQPCKKLYPLYEELASEARHKAAIIIVDISRSYDSGTKYAIRSTPTFITFLHGEQTERWSGADPAKLQGNVKMLIGMAWPPHPHQSLPLSALRSASTNPVLFSKMPPLGKLKAKMELYQVSCTSSQFVPKTVLQRPLSQI